MAAKGQVDKTGWWSDSDPWPPRLHEFALREDAAFDLRREERRLDDLDARYRSEYPAAANLADALRGIQPDWMYRGDPAEEPRVYEVVEVLDRLGLKVVPK